MTDVAPGLPLDLRLKTQVCARKLYHSALTVEALDRRGIPVHGIILNQYEGHFTAERTNPDVLAAMTDVPVWTVPPISIDPPSGISEALRAELTREANPGFGSG